MTAECEFFASLAEQRASALAEQRGEDDISFVWPFERGLAALLAALAIGDAAPHPTRELFLIADFVGCASVALWCMDEDVSPTPLAEADRALQRQLASVRDGVASHAGLIEAPDPRASRAGLLELLTPLNSVRAVPPPKRLQTLELAKEAEAVRRSLPPEIGGLFEMGFVVAGGFLARHLAQAVGYAPSRPSDIDMFMVNVEPSNALAVLRRALLHLGRVAIDNTIFAVRSPFAITVAMDNTEYDIQLVLCVYESVEEMMATIDLDICRVAFDGTRLLLGATCERALYSGVLVLPKNEDPRFLPRVRKYARLGFAAFFPELRLDLEANTDFARDLVRAFPADAEDGQHQKSTPPHFRPVRVLDEQGGGKGAAHEYEAKYECSLKGYIERWRISKNEESHTIPNVVFQQADPRRSGRGWPERECARAPLRALSKLEDASFLPAEMRVHLPPLLCVHFPDEEPFGSVKIASIDG